jgi:hypothetical protein
LPSPNHTWRFVEKSDSGKISDNGVFVSGLTEGETQIEVVDVRETTNTAETMINVVHPYKLSVNILDVTQHRSELESVHPSLDMLKDIVSQSEYQDTNYLVEEHTYLFVLELYDVKNRKITITDNILFNSDILEKVQKNSTGSLILYKASALGKNETQADMRCTFKLD